MKEKTDISIKLLDSILKETMKKGEISIERYLSGKGYSKRIARSIQVKLINDGYAALVNDGECSIKISASGCLFVNDGGYRRAILKEYIPPNHGFDRMYYRYNQLYLAHCLFISSMMSQILS